MKIKLLLFLIFVLKAAALAQSAPAVEKIEPPKFLL